MFLPFKLKNKKSLLKKKKRAGANIHTSKALAAE